MYKKRCIKCLELYTHWWKMVFKSKQSKLCVFCKAK